MLSKYNQTKTGADDLGLNLAYKVSLEFCFIYEQSVDYVSDQTKLQLNLFLINSMGSSQMRFQCCLVLHEFVTNGT